MCYFVKVLFYSDKKKKVPSLKYKYRPHFIVEGDNTYLGVQFIDGNVCSFDIEGDAEVISLYDNVDYSKLVVGAKFKIMEGPNVVGEGYVLDVK